MWAHSHLPACLPAADVLCSDGDAVCVFTPREAADGARRLFFSFLYWQR